MRYLSYVNKDAFLHKLDPRTKFVFFLLMALLISICSTGWALLFLFVFFLGLWIKGKILKEMLFLAKQIKILIIFLMMRFFRKKQN